MAPENLERQLNLILGSETETRYPNNPEYFDILQSYFDFIDLWASDEKERQDIIGRDVSIERAVQNLLHSLDENTAQYSTPEERQRLYEELAALLRNHTHGHHDAFSELELQERAWLEYINNGILPFLRWELLVNRDNRRRWELETLIESFEGLAQTITEESTSTSRHPEAFNTLMSAIVNRYSAAQATETIPERITLLEEQLWQIRILWDSYIQEKDAQTEQTRTDLEAGRQNLIHSLWETLPSQEVPGVWERVLERIGIYPDAQPIGENGTVTPEFEMALQIAQEIEDMDNETLREYWEELSLWYLWNLPLIEGEIPFTDSPLSSEWFAEVFRSEQIPMWANLDQILTENPDFYQRILAEIVAQDANIGELNETEQIERVKERILTDFNAFTQESLRATFLNLQEQLTQRNLYTIDMPWEIPTISFITSDAPTNDERETAIRERNEHIVMTLVFLQRLYREDIDGIWNLEFYSSATASTLWEIYTLWQLNSGNEDIQSVINIASAWVLIYRFWTARNYLRIPRTNLALPWLGRLRNLSDADFEDVRIERERIRDFLVGQAQRESNTAWEKRIGRAYTDFHRHSNSTAFYSAMEEAGNGMRRWTSNITRFVAPLDAANRIMSPYIPGWTNHRLSPRGRLELQEARVNIDNIGQFSFISNDAYRGLNTLFEKARKSRNTTWNFNTPFLEIQTQLDTVRNSQITPDILSVFQREINTSVASNIDNPQGIQYILTRITELSWEIVEIEAIRAEFGFRNTWETLSPAEQAINERINRWLETSNERILIGDLYGHRVVLSNAYGDIIDMEWDSLRLQNHMMERFWTAVNARRIDRQANKIIEVVESARILMNTDEFPSVRSSLINESWEINGRLLDEFNDLRVRIEGYTPLARAAAIQEFIWRHNSVPVPLTPHPDWDRIPPVAPDWGRTPGDAVIDPINVEPDEIRAPGDAWDSRPPMFVIPLETRIESEPVDARRQILDFLRRVEMETRMNGSTRFNISHYMSRALRSENLERFIVELEPVLNDRFWETTIRTWDEIVRDPRFDFSRLTRNYNITPEVNAEINRIRSLTGEIDIDVRLRFRDLIIRALRTGW